MTQVTHAAPGSWWLITCTVTEDDCTTTFTNVLARRLPDEISDPNADALFELLPLGERVLVDVDQIHDATPVTLVAAATPNQPRRRLQLVTSHKRATEEHGLRSMREPAASDLTHPAPSSPTLACSYDATNPNRGWTPDWPGIDGAVMLCLTHGHPAPGDAYLDNKTTTPCAKWPAQ